VGKDYIYKLMGEGLLTIIDSEMMSQWEQLNGGPVIIQQRPHTAPSKPLETASSRSIRNVMRLRASCEQGRGLAEQGHTTTSPIMTGKSSRANQNSLQSITQTNHFLHGARPRTSDGIPSPTHPGRRLGQSLSGAYNYN
jgi:hypothetical protein